MSRKTQAAKKLESKKSLLERSEAAPADENANERPVEQPNNSEVDSDRESDSEAAAAEKLPESDSATDPPTNSDERRMDFKGALFGIHAPHLPL